MTVVRVEKNSPTLDGEILPLSFYAGFYLVFEDNKDNFAVRYNGTAYWFDKKYIERYI